MAKGPTEVVGAICITLTSASCKTKTDKDKVNMALLLVREGKRPERSKKDEGGGRERERGKERNKGRGIRLPPQHTEKGMVFSTDCLHSTHFFMMGEHATYDRRNKLSLQLLNTAMLPHTLLHLPEQTTI